MPILGIMASQGAGTRGSSYESIATSTVGSGGSATVDFSSISSAYTHLQIRCIARSNAAVLADDLRVRFNLDTGANYARHVLYGDGSSAAASNAVSDTKGTIGNLVGASSTASVFNGEVVDILDYADTSKYKTMRALGGYDANGSGYLMFYSTVWLSATAISAIRLYAQSGNISEFSTFALYGIKVAV